ncbi:MAG: hypothetical protein QW733_07580 [Desulfurococcaceae archaeon]
MVMQRGRKGLRHVIKPQLTKFTSSVPTELYEWLRQKAKTEGKTTSLLLTEILETARQKDEEGKQGL